DPAGRIRRLPGPIRLGDRRVPACAGLFSTRAGLRSAFAQVPHAVPDAETARGTEQDGAERARDEPACRIDDFHCASLIVPFPVERGQGQVANGLLTFPFDGTMGPWDRSPGRVVTVRERDAPSPLYYECPVHGAEQA